MILPERSNRALTRNRQAEPERGNERRNGMNRERETQGRSGNGSRAQDAALVAIARKLAEELHSKGHPCPQSPLDAELDRDWGFDSLSRAELVCRIERAFKIRLPESILGEAGTLRDIGMALERTQASPPPFTSAALGVQIEAEGPAVPEHARTLTEVLDWHAGIHGGRRHVILRHPDGNEEPLTYRELAENARAAARGLRQAGLEPGERVAIMLPTGREFLAGFFAILYAGGVPMPIYPPSRPAQIEDHIRRQAAILCDGRASLLITTPEMAAIARLLQFQVECLRRIVSVPELETVRGALPAGAAPQDLALLQYTSGSTGNPKGVTLTHANLLANIRAVGKAMAAEPQDVFVSWLPLYHDMGLIGAWLGSLYFGALLVLMSPLTFLMRPEQWLWAIHQHRATLSAGPNFAFELCLRKIPDRTIHGLDLSSLRMVVNGSEAVLPETIRHFTRRFAAHGFRPEAMAPAYGLAENTVGLAFPPVRRIPVIDRIQRRALATDRRAVPAEPGEGDALEFVACGHPIAENEIRIVDAGGETGERREGRLQFRSSSATAGYFENPAQNAELFDHGWLNSGDLAYVAGGDIFITGRSKDIIIRAGQHIHPEEVEAAIGNIDGVRRGCVVAFGSSDPAGGTERVIILAETRETDPARLGSLQEKANAAAAGLIGGVDEIVLIRPHTIPKTSSGKIRRAAARALYEENRLASAQRPVWRQFLSLALAGGQPLLRRVRRNLATALYALWWWSLLILAGLILWPATLLLPRRRWRWALLRRAARLTLFLMGIPIRKEGTLEAGAGRAPQGGIIAVNHSSYFDALVLAAVLPGEPAFIAKREFRSQFVAGRFLKALGTLFVERRDPEGGIEDTRRALEAARKGRSLVFFPEGTFTRAPGLLPFRLGAFVIAAQQNLPVLPLAMHGTRSILRSDQWLPRHGSVTVHFGEPVRPEGNDFTAALRLRNKVRAALLAHCGEPDLDTGTGCCADRGA